MSYAVRTLIRRQKEIDDVICRYKKIARNSGNFYLKKELCRLERYRNDLQFALRQLSLLDTSTIPTVETDYFGYLKTGKKLK